MAPGALFCAVRGDHVDGHAKAIEAVAAGASALLVQHWLPLAVPQIKVPWSRAAVGPVAAALAGYPAEDLDVIGITGTNGKTTTASLTQAALVAAGRSAGLLGTVANQFGSEQQPAALTTPEAPDLQRVLARWRGLGADSVVMEVSSQGLDQHRVGGITFELGIFLNLGHDHLDYHGTVEQYYAAKARLLEPGVSRNGLICIDDDWGRRLAAQARIPIRTLGQHPAADVLVEVVATGLGGTTVQLSGAVQARLFAPLVGRVHATNIAAAYLAALHLGAGEHDARSGIAGAASVPGRFERIEQGQPFLVIVDYAHTPDALVRMLSTAHDLTAPGGKVTLVVGSRGEKDRFKRPVTGRIAAEGADRPIFTTDSPGDEDPAAILSQMLAGTLDVPRDHLIVQPDRRLAIRAALGGAGPGDVVLIVGRGHEPRRRTKAGWEEFDDRAVARQALTDCGFALPEPQVAALR